MAPPLSASKLLAPDGAVAKLLPGYEPRPQQRQMAAAVERALADKRISIVEAGTGTGKSFGYLFAAVLHAVKTGTPAVVASSTHVLQDQLIRKDIPFVQKVLEQHGIQFEAAEVKGMGAYLCRAALAEAGGTLLIEYREACEKLDEWVKTAEEGTRSEAPAVPAEVWEEVRVDPDTCTRDKCFFYDSCFFFRARRRAQGAQLLVANHSLVFADLAVKESGGLVLPVYSLLILDEAQNIEDAATNFLGTDISPRGIGMVLRRAYDARGRGTLSAVEQEMQQSDKLRDHERTELLEFLNGQVYGAFRDAYMALEEGFPRIEGAYRALVAESPEARAAARRAAARRAAVRAADAGAGTGDSGDAIIAFHDPAREDRESLRALRLHPRMLEHEAMVDAQAAAHLVAGKLSLAAERLRAFLLRMEIAETVDNQRDFLSLHAAVRTLQGRSQGLRDFFDPASGAAEDVKWFQPEFGRRGAFQVRLCRAPIDVAPHLEQRLFKELEACVLTSATLAVGRDFGYFRGRVGLAGELKDRCDTLMLDSPFDFARHVLVGVPEDLPDPAARDTDFIRQAARFIWRALRVSKGRSLVLFHSWATLRATYKMIAPHAGQLGFRVLCQGEPGMSKNQLIETFRNDVHSVLMATTSYREGVDVPGEALSNLIVHRLPFSVPDEPVPAARMERIDEAGGNSFNDYALPAAVIAFKQAFGRLIRCHSDRGIFLCCDKRLLTKRYGVRFMEALPKCRIVHGKSDKVLAAAHEFLAVRVEKQ